MYCRSKDGEVDYESAGSPRGSGKLVRGALDCAAPSAQALLHLQSSAGNRAVARLLSQRTASPSERQLQKLARCGAGCNCGPCRDEAGSELEAVEAIAHAAMKRRLAAARRQTARTLARQDDDGDGGLPPGGAPVPPGMPPPGPGPDPVFLCWSPTEAAPSANHAWLRVGGPEPSPDHETFSLFPRLVGKDDQGASCAQGFTFRGADDTEGSKRVGKCKRIAITPGCVELGFSRYPIGIYCPGGPNSNTFVGTVVRGCMINDDAKDSLPGRATLDGDWVPGWDDDPPQSGTFGPNWIGTGMWGVITCAKKNCGTST